MNLELHDESNPKNIKKKVIRNPDDRNYLDQDFNQDSDLNSDLNSDQMPDRAIDQIDEIDEIDELDELDQTDANLDPISGEPGSHPLGTSVGAAGGGSVATIVGSVVAGPVGAMVGAVIGSVVGGLAGKGTAEKINPTFEDDHWRENYGARPYVEKGAVYADYQHAYRVGYEGFDRYGQTGHSYEELEPKLRRDYEKAQNSTGISWAEAKEAVKDAWERAAASRKP